MRICIHRMLTFCYWLVPIHGSKLLCLMQGLGKGTYYTCNVVHLCLSLLFCSYIHNDLEVALVGTKVDLTYEYNVC